MRGKRAKQLRRAAAGRTPTTKESMYKALKKLWNEHRIKR